jgi:hypothetical protein
MHAHAFIGALTSILQTVRIGHARVQYVPPGLPEIRSYILLPANSAIHSRIPAVRTSMLDLVEMVDK